MKKLINRGIFGQTESQLLSWYFQKSMFEYENQKCRTENGAPQGSIISPALFTIVSDKFLRQIEAK